MTIKTPMYIYQIAIKNANILHSKTRRNVGLFGLKKNHLETLLGASRHIVLENVGTHIHRYPHT
jgi:hypothetical protein